MRVGIISANWGAIAHLPAWRSLPGVEVVGICTSRQETAEPAAERFGIPRAFWNAEEMIADPEIDIVDCGTRPSIRHPRVMAALKAGKHVYNGIPFAASLEDSRSLYEAYKASESVAIVDAYSQWLPAPQRAKEMLDEGYIGTPFGGTARFNLPLFNQPMKGFPWLWFSEKGHGVSAVRNLGSHLLHMLHFLFGEVEELVAEDTQLLSEWRFHDGETVPVETNDFANVMLRFKSGLRLQMQVGWTAAVGQGFSVDVFGSDGRMLMESPTFPTSADATLRAAKLGSMTLEPVDLPDRLMNPPGIGIGPEVQPQAAHGMAISMQAMIKAIKEGGPAAPDFTQAWNVERVQEAIRLSSEERRWVALEDIG